MAADGLSNARIIDILTTTRRVALVGASNKPERASFGVMRFLLENGFDVTPVNPGLAGQTIQDRPVVASLAETGPLEMVDVFRNAREVGTVMDEAIRLGAKIVWLQLGVINEEAAAVGREAGLTVVMDRCPAIEWARLGLGRAARAE